MLMKRKPKVTEIKIRAHRALFDSTLPFRGRKEACGKVFRRRAKHNRNEYSI